jgi:hypothetical protein
MALILTVCGTSTEVGPVPFLGEYKLALKRVLTKVDFPNPDSPMSVRGVWKGHTDDHDIEIESLSHGFTMPLVGEVCESDVAC